MARHVRYLEDVALATGYSRITRYLQLQSQGRVRNFSLAARPNSQKSRPNADSGSEGLGVGQQSHPHQLGRLGERCDLLQRDSGRNPDRPTVFHYFQHGMASPDTIVLLIMDYLAAIGGRGDRRARPCVRPVQILCIDVRRCRFVTWSRRCWSKWRITECRRCATRHICA